MSNTIAPIEIIEPLYIATEYINVFGGGKKVRRHNRTGKRLYTTEDGTSYVSLTTFIGDTNLKADTKYLDSWRNEMIEILGSPKAVDEYVQMTANFGTWLHIAISDFVKAGFIDWMQFTIDTSDFLRNNGFHNETILRTAIMELKKDMASIIQFFCDYKVTVLAVEIPVFKDNIATCIDLVVEMLKTPKGEERHRAIINLKSGKKGNFDSHKLQLCWEREMFNNTYSFPNGGSQIKSVYNIAPKNWTKQIPTYSVYNNTEEMEDFRLKFKARLDRANTEGYFKNLGLGSVCVLSGITNYGDSVEKNIRFQKIGEYLNIEGDTIIL